MILLVMKVQVGIVVRYERVLKDEENRWMLVGMHGCYCPMRLVIVDYLDNKA